MRYKQLQFHDRYNSGTVVRLRPNSEGRIETNSEVQIVMNVRDICCNYKEELFQFDVYITEIASNVIKLF